MMITAKKRIATGLPDRRTGIACGAAVKIALSLESNNASDRATPVCQIINSGKNWAFGRFSREPSIQPTIPRKPPIPDHKTILLKDRQVTFLGPNRRKAAPKIINAPTAPLMKNTGRGISGPDDPVEACAGK
jgi:hypothetical protein